LSLERGFSLNLAGHRFVGYSLAGITTSIGVPEAQILFDVGQGLPWQVGFSNIALTHAHMDHASGLPYLISQKSMQRRPTPVVYMPESALDPFHRMMKIWHEIDQFEYELDFRAAKAGESYDLGQGYKLQPFPTFHRVPSLGYSLIKQRKRLKSEWSQATPQELSQKRREGVELDEYYDENLLSFTGDTRIEFLQSSMARSSKCLFMEVTYWDERKSVANAREWGHIHFDEFLKALPQIESSHIVLIHASSRYTTRELMDHLRARVPEHEQTRITLWPR